MALTTTAAILGLVPKSAKLAFHMLYLCDCVSTHSHSHNINTSKASILCRYAPALRHLYCILLRTSTNDILGQFIAGFCLSLVTKLLLEDRIRCKYMVVKHRCDFYVLQLMLAPLWFEQSCKIDISNLKNNCNRAPVSMINNSYILL